MMLARFLRKWARLNFDKDECRMPTQEMQVWERLDVTQVVAVLRKASKEAKAASKKSGCIGINEASDKSGWIAHICIHGVLQSKRHRQKEDAIKWRMEMEAAKASM